MPAIDPNQPLIDEINNQQAQQAEKQNIGAAGAAAGAAIGTVIFPGIGTAIGAAIGGLASLFGGNRKPKPKVNPNLPVVPGLAPFTATGGVQPSQQQPASDSALLWAVKQFAAQASLNLGLNDQIQQSNVDAGAAQRQQMSEQHMQELALGALAGVFVLAAIKRKR